MKVWRSSGEVAFDAAWVAEGFFSRFKGLMGRKGLRPGEAVLFRRCSSVHCMFMRIPIDVVSLDEDGTVLAVQTVDPWRKVGRTPGCASVLECAAGAAAAHGLVVGMRVEFGKDSGTGV